MTSDRTSGPESDDAPQDVPGAQHDDAEDVPGSQHGDTAQDDADEAARGGTGAQPELPEPTED